MSKQNVNGGLIGGLACCGIPSCGCAFLALIFVISAIRSPPDAYTKIPPEKREQILLTYRSGLDKIAFEADKKYPKTADDAANASIDEISERRQYEKDEEQKLSARLEKQYKLDDETFKDVIAKASADRLMGIFKHGRK